MSPDFVLFYPNEWRIFGAGGIILCPLGAFESSNALLDGSNLDIEKVEKKY